MTPRAAALATALLTAVAAGTATPASGTAPTSAVLTAATLTLTGVTPGTSGGRLRYHATRLRAEGAELAVRTDGTTSTTHISRLDLHDVTVEADRIRGTLLNLVRLTVSPDVPLPPVTIAHLVLTDVAVEGVTARAPRATARGTSLHTA